MKMYLTDKFRPGVVDVVEVEHRDDGRLMVDGRMYPKKLTSIELHQDIEDALMVAVDAMGPDWTFRSVNIVS